MEFEKYHKIKRLGDDENKEIFKNPEDDIVIQEKIDGANFRFYVTEKGQLIFGSRTQQLTSNEGEDTNVSKNFKKCVEFVRETLKDKNLNNFKNLIFYGECCVCHTLVYDWTKMPPFLGFDIRDSTTGEYLNYSLTSMAYKELGLEMVPLISIIKAKDVELPLRDEYVPDSKYASMSSKDTKAEGIVFKNYDKQLFAKFVRDAFKEKNGRVFGGSPKYNKIDDTDNAEFIFKYVTNSRIEKLILKKIDEGNLLSMKLMGSLIMETYLDIIEEEWREILTSNWKLDFKGLRKRVAPRVRGVLETMIENNIVLK